MLLASKVKHGEVWFFGRGFGLCVGRLKSGPRFYPLFSYEKQSGDAGMKRSLIYIGSRICFFLFFFLYADYFKRLFSKVISKVEM